MSLNAAAIEIMVAKGLSGEDILSVARALEAGQKTDSAADKRRAYDRERKREQREAERLSGGKSGGNSDGQSADKAPPKENISKPPVPFSNENGADRNSDKQFWDSAKSYLGKNKASLIGKWVSEHGKEETAAAITAAQLDRAVNPVEFIQGRFRKIKHPAHAGWDGMP